MVSLSLLHSHLEIAILINNRTATRLVGSPRWPGRAWVDELTSVTRRKHLQLSMHLCGEPVRQLLTGELDWSGLTSLVHVAQRVQINTHAEPHISTVSMLRSLQEGADIVRRDIDRQFIFQWDQVNNHLVYMPHHYDHNVAVLFDYSHGAGILPGMWPDYMDDLPCGYAGGLGPDNLAEQLPLIQDASAGNDFWIDMETRVRTDDGSRLDLVKVQRALELTAPLIGK